MEKQEIKAGSGLGCLFRFFWMIAGPGAILFSLGFIVENGVRFPSLYDGIFLMAVVALIVVRYLDIRCFAGTTGECDKPATMSDWRRFAGMALALSVLAWSLVRVLVWIRS